MVQAVANTMFFEDRKNEGNKSKAIDYILTQFRLYSRYSGLIKLLMERDESLRGNPEAMNLNSSEGLLTVLTTMTPELRKDLLAFLVLKTVSEATE